VADTTADDDCLIPAGTMEVGSPPVPGCGGELVQDVASTPLRGRLGYTKSRQIWPNTRQFRFGLGPSDKGTGRSYLVLFRGRYCAWKFFAPLVEFGRRWILISISGVLLKD